MFYHALTWFFDSILSKGTEIKPPLVYYTSHLFDFLTPLISWTPQSFIRFSQNVPHLLYFPKIYDPCLSEPPSIFLAPKIMFFVQISLFFPLEISYLFFFIELQNHWNVFTRKSLAACLVVEKFILLSMESHFNLKKYVKICDQS